MLRTELATIDDSVPAALDSAAVAVHDLAADVRRLEMAARADKTREVYASAVRSFERWCDANGMAAIGASVEAVKAYLAHLTKLGRAPNTVNVHLHAIAHAHRHVGLPFDTRVFESVLDGVRRSARRQPKQSRAATADVIEGVVFGDDLKGKRDRALILLGFWTARRRSELAGLDWQRIGQGDGFVEITAEGVLVTLLRSKTNAHGAREQYAVPADVADLTEALRAWIDAAGIQPGEPLFRSIDRHGNVGARISSHSVGVIMTTRLGEGYTGHAVRRGFITDAANNGLTALDIMRQSGHKSHDLVRAYVEDAEKFKNNAAGALARRKKARG